MTRDPGNDAHTQREAETSDLVELLHLPGWGWEMESLRNLVLEISPALRALAASTLPTLIRGLFLNRVVSLAGLAI